MIELTFSDQLAIWGIVATIAVGVVIFIIQMRLSDKVNKAILEQKKRNDGRKIYHLRRLKSNTELLKRELVWFKEMFCKHRKQPTIESWKNLTSIAKRNSEQANAFWLVIQQDIAQLNDLVTNRYLVDKYYDVNIYLTWWTYKGIAEGSGLLDRELLEIDEWLTQQIDKFDETLGSIKDEYDSISGVSA